jgi:hypothetical protein
MGLKKVLAIFLLSLMFFSGCEDEDAKVYKSFNGKAIDGYLANAKVYYEGYKNEATTTDESGSFSLKYRGTKLIVEPLYDENNQTLTVDIQTGESFENTLSAPSDYEIVTPLTTVVAETGIEEKELAKKFDLNRA